MRYMGSGVVPLEKLHLRQLWSKFRSSRSKNGQKPLPLELPTTLPDDLPDDAAFFKRISYKLAP